MYFTCSVILHWGTLNLREIFYDKSEVTVVFTLCMVWCSICCLNPSSSTLSVGENTPPCGVPVTGVLSLCGGERLPLMVYLYFCTRVAHIVVVWFYFPTKIFVLLPVSGWYVVAGAQAARPRRLGAGRPAGDSSSCRIGCQTAPRSIPWVPGTRI